MSVAPTSVNIHTLFPTHQPLLLRINMQRGRVILAEVDRILGRMGPCVPQHGDRISPRLVAHFATASPSCFFFFFVSFLCCLSRFLSVFSPARTSNLLVSSFYNRNPLVSSCYNFHRSSIQGSIVIGARDVCPKILREQEQCRAPVFESAFPVHGSLLRAPGSGLFH